MSYQPGQHLIANLHTSQIDLLRSHARFKSIADQLVRDFDLQKLGEVYHNFSPEGFTGVICLSESHISIHTWPEHGKLNIDIYLSNYQRTNDGIVVKIFDSICNFFSAEILYQTSITR